MADLPTDSIRRIADARHQAEAELKKAISAVPETDDVAVYLPAFMSFASALFDAEADELLYTFSDAQGFQAALENEVAPQIIDGILPYRSLDRMRVRRTDEVTRLSIEHDMNTDLLWEVGPDGTRRPARPEIQGVFTQHGDWENFTPQDARYLVRLPNNSSRIRAALNGVLQRRAFYWLGQFEIRIASKGERIDSTAIEDSGTELSQLATAPSAGNRADRLETKAVSHGIGALQIPGLKKWPDLKLKFTSGKNIRVVVDGVDRGVHTFTALGFAVPVSSQPVKAWHTLLEFAEARGEGIPTYEAGHRSDSIRARIRKLNAILSTVFGLKEQPIRSSSGRALPSFQLEPPPLIRDFRDYRGSSPEIQMNDEVLADLAYDRSQSRKRRSRGAGPGA